MEPPPIPPAPWRLRGQAVVFLAAPLRLRLLVNYRSSPVGPYLEHALACLAWRGPQVVQMSVTLLDSMRGGRAIWGFPKTLENLSWQSDGPRVIFSRGTQNFRVRACGPRFPLVLPFWTVQILNGEAVRVPGKIKARARLAFRGRQIALLLEEFEMTIEAPQKLTE